GGPEKITLCKKGVIVGAACRKARPGVMGEKADRVMKVERKVNRKLRSILGTRLEGAREAVLRKVNSWQGYREMPAYWGFYASAPTVACRNCGLVLPLAWKSAEKPCLCGKPDPAVMVPLHAVGMTREDMHEMLEKVYEEAKKEVELEEAGATA
ncbi:MAG: hypothetical protein ACUVSK_13430, partial [Desulfotomaculales bacterium]